MIIALVLAGLFLYVPNITSEILGNTSTITTSFSLQASTSESSPSSSSVTTESIAQNVTSPPLIQNGVASIPYPRDYGQLAAYSITAINRDRNTFQLAPVTLSPNAVAQQHADSMLYYGYFSHLDTQGYKPYMRYSLLGGAGAIEENVAFISWPQPHFDSVARVESAIQALESSMMYNDSACCNNGHKDNILTATHNRVAIGVAYNVTDIYFVEDFENYYLDLGLSVSNSIVSMNGTPVNSTTNPNEVAIFYDPTPVPESSQALNSGPREYDSGLLIGGVLPSCSIFSCATFQTITVYASIWDYSASHVSISFSLSPFIQKYGAGVYTIYLLPNDNVSSSMTSISVFVSA